MADIDRLIGFMAIMQVPFMNDPDALAYIEEVKTVLKQSKAQEAVEPIPPKDESDLWKCGNCNHQLFRCTHQRYCEMCGRAVKWDD